MSQAVAVAAKARPTSDTGYSCRRCPVSMRSGDPDASDSRSSQCAWIHHAIPYGMALRIGRMMRPTVWPASSVSDTPSAAASALPRPSPIR